MCVKDLVNFGWIIFIPLSQKKQSKQQARRSKIEQEQRL